jgi:type II secretory pathway pseudopilin PulG
MHINRRFLYAGVFLLAIGAVLVLADLGVFDATALANALRVFWPLAVIALGIGVVLRRTQFSLQAGLLAAALPGLVLGGAFAVGPRAASECGRSSASATMASQQGSFQGPATVTLTGGCGALTVKTASGDAWQLMAANSANRQPFVRSSPFSLSIDSSENEGWPFRDTGRNTWDLTLPTNNTDNLSMVVYAGQGNVALPGARLRRLAVTANAAKVVVDASAAASVSNLSGTVRVGMLSIDLPDSDVAGTFRVGGGRLQLCAPPGVGVRLTSTGFPKEFEVAGEHQGGSGWESENYASATHRADLQVSANFGSVEINPTGGCR